MEISTVKEKEVQKLIVPLIFNKEIESLQIQLMMRKEFSLREKEIFSSAIYEYLFVPHHHPLKRL